MRPDERTQQTHFKNRMATRFLLAVLLCVSAPLRESSAAAAWAEARAKLPNIVFLLADDLGTSDLGCYGHPYTRTPNIDSLARDGTRFTQYQATGATCCPARKELMTS